MESKLGNGKNGKNGKKASRSIVDIIDEKIMKNPEIIQEKKLEISSGIFGSLKLNGKATQGSLSFDTFIENLLKDDNEVVRLGAINVLAEVGGRRSRELIRNALSDHSEKVQTAAFEIYCDIAGQPIKHMKDTLKNLKKVMKGIEDVPSHMKNEILEIKKEIKVYKEDIAEQIAGPTEEIRAKIKELEAIDKRLKDVESMCGSLQIPLAIIEALKKEFNSKIEELKKDKGSESEERIRGVISIILNNEEDKVKNRIAAEREKLEALKNGILKLEADLCKRIENKVDSEIDSKIESKIKEIKEKISEEYKRREEVKHKEEINKRKMYRGTTKFKVKVGAVVLAILSVITVPLIILRSINNTNARIQKVEQKVEQKIQLITEDMKKQSDKTEAINNQINDPVIGLCLEVDILNARLEDTETESQTTSSSLNQKYIKLTNKVNKVKEDVREHGGRLDNIELRLSNADGNENNLKQ